MRIITSKPVAIDSRDHWDPMGTKNDNSVNPRFNQKLYCLIPAGDVRLLDIGCAGGGLVASILDDGGTAVGIEGSDYSLVQGRGEWPKLANRNLFTADVTEKFVLEHDFSYPQRFNVVTAWEFFEHIAENKIAAVCGNILSHLAQDGFFIGSICERVENHHVTVKPKAWWIEKFAECGLRHEPWIEEHFGEDLVRREGFVMGAVRA